MLLRSPMLLSLITVLVVVLFIPQCWGVVQAKGNPNAIIMVSSARTSTNNPLRSLTNVTLWCQVYFPLLIY